MPAAFAYENYIIEMSIIFNLTLTHSSIKQRLVSAIRCQEQPVHQREESHSKCDDVADEAGRQAGRQSQAVAVAVAGGIIIMLTFVNINYT